LILRPYKNVLTRSRESVRGAAIDVLASEVVLRRREVVIDQRVLSNHERKLAGGLNAQPRLSRICHHRITTSRNVRKRTEFSSFDPSLLELEEAYNPLNQSF